MAPGTDQQTGGADTLAAIGPAPDTMTRLSQIRQITPGLGWYYCVDPAAFAWPGQRLELSAHRPERRLGSKSWHVHLNYLFSRLVQ